jgi:hypothetical protein
MWCASSPEAWKQVFLKDVVPQIPLSVLNVVVVVCKLTHDLFLEKVVSTTLVSVTMGGYWFGALTNLLGCWFGRRANTSLTRYVAVLDTIKLALRLMLES